MAERKARTRGVRGKTRRVDAAEGASGEDDGRSWLLALTRFWVAVALTAAILFGAALWVARSEGFRSLLADRIENAFGFRLVIETSRLSPGGVMILEGIRMKDPRMGDLRIAEAQFELSWRAWLRGRGLVQGVSVDGGSLILERDAASGRWQPEAFRFLNELLGPWLGLGGVSRGGGANPVAGGIAAGGGPPNRDSGGASGADVLGSWSRELPPDWHLRLHRMNVVWREAGGAAVASLDGLELACEVADLLDEQVVRYQVGVDTVLRGSDLLASDVRMEGLRLGDREIGLSLQGDVSGLAVQPGSNGMSPEAQRALDLMNQFEATRVTPGDAVPGN